MSVRRRSSDGWGEEAAKIFLRRTGQVGVGKLWYRTTTGWKLVFTGGSAFSETVVDRPTATMTGLDANFVEAYSRSLRDTATATMTGLDANFVEAYSRSLRDTATATMTGLDANFVEAYSRSLRDTATATMTGLDLEVG